MILLLAGTSEARDIAHALAAGGFAATASLAGATREPAPLAVPTRHGGFGGAAGFTSVLEDLGVTAIIDATHPFAARISQRTQSIAAARGLPYLQVLRPAWAPRPDDRWHMVTREEEVATLVPVGATAFLATGRQTLSRFANMTGRTLYCRQIDPPEGAFPFAGGSYVIGRPPFTVEDEIETFTRLDVDWLVVKNAGGAASATKLEAARLLRKRVAMIDRPTQPPGDKAIDVDEALAWVAAL